MRETRESKKPDSLMLVKGFPDGVCGATRLGIYVMGGGGWESGEVLQAFNGIKIEFGSDLADFAG